MFIGVLSTTITFVFAMFILRPIRLLSSDSSCSICCSSCGVSVHRNMSSAKRRLERNSPSIFTPLCSQFNLLNMLSNVAVNSLGEMVSPCLTPLLILIFSLSLCRCTVTELSVYGLLFMLKGPRLKTVSHRTLGFPDYGMANASNFTRGFTPASNPERGK